MRDERNGSVPIPHADRNDAGITDDPRIAEMFQASRLAHEKDAPRFQEMLRGTRYEDATQRMRRWSRMRALVAATAMTFAGAALAMAIWTGIIPTRLAPATAPAGSDSQSAGYSPPPPPPPPGHARSAFSSIGPTPPGPDGALPGRDSKSVVVGANVIRDAAALEMKSKTAASEPVTEAELAYADTLALEPVTDSTGVLAGPSVRTGGVPSTSPYRTGTVIQGAVAPIVQGRAMARANASAKRLGTQAGDVLPRARGYYDLDDLVAPGANTESYGTIVENEFLAARENPLSTFSIDVDTASFANVRRFLESGTLPPAAAVRLEELINYFPYDDPPPSGEAPFATRVEIAECPWNAKHRLARIALKAQDVSHRSRPASNLVFLIDVSGSMDEPAKLPLVVSSLEQLVSRLDGRDSIAIVVYAGASGLVLPPTSGADRGAILLALERLQAGGGTNGGEGLRLAYQTARKGFIPGGVNRVILATDGDFNLGVTDRTELLRLIARESGGGVFLTSLGYGMGNYKDDFLETLADKGNGNYAYIDSPREARKVLVEGMGGTLVTVAKDVKIQVEFNPQRVESYRLIGYENRMLAKEDFNDDTKDAGEIGAGSSVTALYEIVPAGSSEKVRSVDPLRYQKPVAAVTTDEAVSTETLTVKLRYKEPEGKESKLIEVPAADSGLSARSASADFKFASSVAMFGMVLRQSPHRGDATFESLQRLGCEGIGRDTGGYRADFLRIAAIAARLRGAERPEGDKSVQPVAP